MALTRLGGYEATATRLRVRLTTREDETALFVTAEGFCFGGLTREAYQMA
jgi:hypothetical protein